MTPIRTATNTALKPIKVGNRPWDIATTPNGRTAYVTNQGSGTVTPIRNATNTAFKPIKVGSGPGPIAITPDGKTAYVVAAGKVTPIRTATNTALEPIKISGGTGVPVDIVITPDGKTAYVNDFRADTVTPIRTATNTALKPVKVGIMPRAFAITLDGKILYVAGNAGTVTPIRTATNTTLKPSTLKAGLAAIVIARRGRAAGAIGGWWPRLASVPPAGKGAAAARPSPRPAAEPGCAWAPRPKVPVAAGGLPASGRGWR